MKNSILLGLVILLSACGAQKVIPLKDNINKTERLRISVGMDEEYMTHEDPNFDRIKDYISKQESQWGQPLGTFPSPQVTVAFLDSANNLLFPLWIGPNWIGTRHKENSFLKNIPENEIDSLKIMLGQQ